MKWADRLLSGAAIAAAKFILVSILAYFGLTSEWFHALWLLFLDSPAWVTLGVTIGGILWGFVSRPIQAESPDSLPRYFLFYLSPIRRISWRFERIFNSYLDYEKKLQVANFPFYLKANWGRDLRPIYGVIRSRATGKSIEVSLAGPPPEGGYVPASTIESCTSGVWVSGVAEFSPPIPADNFMLEFGDFDLLFEYDNHQSFQLYFSKREVQGFLSRWHIFFDEQQRRLQPTVRVKA